MSNEALILTIAFFAISVFYMNLNYKVWAKHYKESFFLLCQLSRLIIGLIVSFIGYYFLTIAITPWVVLAYHGIVIAIIQLISVFITDNEDTASIMLRVIFLVFGIILVLVLSLQPLIFWGASYDYVKEKTIQTDELIIVSTNDMNLVTQATAKRDAKISLANFDNTSRYKNGDLYKQEINGEKIWVSPVEYSDFFRALGSDKYLPGYITTAVSTNKKITVVDDLQMVYAPTALFNNKLNRHVHFEYPDVLLYTPAFELDDEGNAYWIVPYGNYKFFNYLPIVEGVITVEPTTGECAQYTIENIPTWINTVIPADIAEDYCNIYGERSKSPIDAMFFPDEQFTLTTWVWQNEYEQTPLGDDAWSIIFDETGQMWYVSDTTRTKGSERTMVGYIMVSAKTGEIKYNPSIKGVNGNGICQNFKQPYKEKTGWVLAEPTLYSIDNIPTWFSVIVDENGEIQMYCFGTLEGEIATDTSFGKALSLYRSLINSNGSIPSDSETSSSLEINGIVYRVNTIGDNTYIIVSTNKELVISVPDYISHLAKMTYVGDTVNIKYNIFEGKEAVANTFNVLMK